MKTERKMVPSWTEVERSVRGHPVQGSSFQEFTTKLERHVVERGEPNRIPQVFFFFFSEKIGVRNLVPEELFYRE